MASEAELALVLEAIDRGFAKNVKAAKEETSGLGKTMQSVGTIATGFLAANVVGAGVQKLTGFMSDSIAAAQESKDVNAQLEAVLKSTGGAAGVTAQHVADLASSIEKHSVFEDEAVLKGQNLLLTFTNVKNAADGSSHVFDDATQIMVDMAQAMGTDAAGSAIQLGKALNDPTNGITALTRVGVTFTDEQKAQIQAMQEAGDIAGAQGVILAELQKEFGGSAQAASDAAGANEVYKDRMNDLQEQIGGKLLPVQLKLKEIEAEAIAFIADKVIPVLESLYAEYYPGVAKAVTDVADQVQKYWPEISAVIEFGVDFVKTKIEGMIQTVQGIIEVVTGVVNLVDDLIHGRWSQAWDDLKQIVAGVLDIMIGNIKQIFGNIPEIVLGLIEDAASAAERFAQGMFDAIVRILEALPGKMAQLGRDAANAFLNSISVAGISAGDVVGAVGSLNPFRAAGGPVSAYQPYIVGERGPELFIPGNSGSIVPNSALGGGVSVYIQGPVYARDQAEAMRAGGDIGWAISLRRRGLAA